MYTACEVNGVSRLLSARKNRSRIAILLGTACSGYAVATLPARDQRTRTKNSCDHKLRAARRVSGDVTLHSAKFVLRVLCANDNNNLRSVDLDRVFLCVSVLNLYALFVRRPDYIC